MKQQSILFVTPDYHGAFSYRDELKRLGWKVGIYVPNGYPEKLLYSDVDILRPPKARGMGSLNKYVDMVLACWLYLTVFWKYKYHYYYGGLDRFFFFESKLGITKIFGDSFRIHLWLAKLFKIKVIQLPSGCLEEETKANFS